MPEGRLGGDALDKVKQRPQEVRDAMQKSNLMSVSLWASANEVVGVGLPKSLELTTCHLVS